MFKIIYIISFFLPIIKWGIKSGVLFPYKHQLKYKILNGLQFKDLFLKSVTFRRKQDPQKNSGQLNQ